MVLRSIRSLSCFYSTLSNKYRSPYVPKLIELDTRYSLVRPEMRVLEIGCYPGGWTQYLVSKVGSTEENPLVTSIDIQSMNGVPGSNFVHCDISDERSYEEIEKAIGYQKVDLVFIETITRFVQMHVQK